MEVGDAVIGWGGGPGSKEVGIESSGIPGMTLNRLADTDLYR